MKVIQVMPEFAVGGAEIMAENLSYELKKLGCDVIVVSLFNLHTAITDRMEQNGIRVEFFNKKPGFDFSQIRKLYKFFKIEKPDVVHTHRNSIQYAVIAAKMAEVPAIVHTIHSIAQKENGVLQRKLNKFFFSKLGVIPVSLSKKVQESVIEEYKIDENNVPIIFNGVSVENINKKCDYCIGQTLKIAHVGRFSLPKNHKCLIDVFERLHKIYPNSILNLYGTGELEEDLRLNVRRKGLCDSVIFNGVVNNVTDELIKNDIFCLPSIYEGVPLSLIEAMISAMPIVTTNVGGIPDMLENNKDAFLVNVSDDEILCKLIELINSEDLRRRFGENSRGRSKVFSSSHMSKQYEELYQKQIKKGVIQNERH